MTFSRLAKEVLVEVLRVKSIVQREVADIIKEEGENWMLPIREYILYATLPIDPQKARKLRIKAPQDRMIDDNLYRKSYMSPWLQCVGPVKAKSIIQEIHQVYHPQANGQVEVTNRDIVKGIERRLGKTHQGWKDELQQCKQSRNLRKMGPTWEGPYVVKKAYRDGAYKLESPSGSLVDQTWNGLNLRLRAEALSSFMTERKHAHVQLSFDARILKVTLTKLGPHNIFYLSVNDSGARLRIRGCAPYHGLGSVSEVGLRIRGWPRLLPRSGGTLVGFCFYFMAEGVLRRLRLLQATFISIRRRLYAGSCYFKLRIVYCPKLKSKWEEAIIDHDLEGTMLPWLFFKIVLCLLESLVEDVGALLSLDNVKDYASNSDALYDSLCDKKGVVSRPHKTNCFHPLCGHDLDGCVSFRELALVFKENLLCDVVEDALSRLYAVNQRCVKKPWVANTIKEAFCGSENNLYKIGATGATYVTKQTYCDWPLLGGGYVPGMRRMLHNIHVSKDVPYHACFGGCSLPCMLQRMLPTIHALEGTAYQACFRGCYLPCMLQRVLPIMHASEDAAYQACFEGCCLPCMLRMVLLTKPASEGVAYHACFRGCFLVYMLWRMLLTIHSSEGVAYHACLGGCCLPGINMVNTSCPTGCATDCTMDCTTQNQK
nr:reverse transcriptase domain-containing protein [Tanacetum cinerariifolium]